MSIHGGGFFVMMYSQNGYTAMPIMTDDEIVKFWPTEAAAKKEMRDHVFANAFGYEIFEMGQGNS